jgi:hypothetical protein
VANDISIVVSADLGDTLIKLDLAKHGINELGDASEETAAKQDAATISTGFFSTALAGMNDMLSGSSTQMPALASSLEALPVILGVAAVAVVALADAFGTLVAIVADFVAPLSLVIGLLGGLGAGFIFAGISAAKGGGSLQPFADKLATLHSMFDKTGQILAHTFLPYLTQLAGAAEKALLFIDKLAKEPLAKAFRDMSTQGVQMLNSFIQQVAHVLAHPIRLAFKIAFGEGPGGGEIASAVAGWWHQLSDYLFGYSQKHQIHIGRFLGPMTTTQVDGVFQPLIDWFNRHHFTKQGTQIGHAILNGFMSSGAAQRLGQFLDQILLDAIKTVVLGGIHLWQYQFRVYGQLIHQAADMIVSALGRAWDWVKDHIHGVLTVVEVLVGIIAGPLVGAFNSVLGVINTIVGAIRGAIGAAQSLASAVGSAVGGSNTLGTGKTVGGAAGGIGHFHFHAAAGSNSIAEHAAFSRFSRQVGAELGRQQARLAVGH